MKLFANIAGILALSPFVLVIAVLAKALRVKGRTSKRMAYYDSLGADDPGREIPTNETIDDYGS